jgi:alpha-amylase
MNARKLFSAVFIVLAIAFHLNTAGATAGEQPIAIFHAFNQNFHDIEQYVCEVAAQGYSHIQIPPAQKSNPAPEWWARYQPVDYGVIEGMGSEADLKRLIDKAHGCNVKVIADVVFNHMANLGDGDAFEDLGAFPGLSRRDFRTVQENPGARPCEIRYNDGNRDTELDCWLGGLPDLIHNQKVKELQTAHIRKLLALGIDGFRFDAAKHMATDVVKEYIDFIDRESQWMTWNYLEVITDGDTNPQTYNWIAAITDFVLYHSMKQAFTFGGDLRTLRGAEAVDDSRSVTFGRNHDTIREINPHAISPYDDATDSYLATGYVLARESGTPLVLNWDNLDCRFIRHGVKFRRIMKQRRQEGRNVKESVLAVVDSPTALVMERGNEGFLVLNKGTERLDLPVLDMTLTNLEGCYRELRNQFTVAIERRPDGRKYVTRWGSWNRGGVEIHSRDALYFVREPFSACEGD